MTNASQTNSLEKVKDFRVLGRIATSWGLFLIMVVAPLFWGLLPIGYGILNSNDAIKANPFFTVFMRMATSFILTALCAIVIWLGFCVFTRNQERKSSFLNLCRQIIVLAKSRMVWLVLLFVCYFGARALEMKSILTYTLEKNEIVATISETQKDNSYLGMQDSVVSGQWEAIKKRTTNALKDYGYFMGLMLALLLAVKNNTLYGALSKALRNRCPDFAKNLDRLQGGRMTFVGTLFWLSTLFLTVASGILYIASKEPLYVWPFIGEMTGIACIVALLTSFGTDSKILGNLNVDANFKGCPNWTPALVASVTMNLFQAGGTALLAIACWFLTRPAGTSFSSLATQYFRGANSIWLIGVIGLLGSVVAPIAQLFGVNWHDAKLKDIGIKRYGVTGSDWLMICGGFEPLFVVLIGLLIPKYRGDLISIWPMLIAVLTVAVIALLKIAEVWSEKNSVVRNAIFAKVRGSTQDTHEDETPEQLRERAIKLSYLKFYDKRSELSAHAASLVLHAAIDKCNLPSVPALPDAYLAFLVDGQYFFTQDDPFTNTVLGAHELYLKRKFPEVEVISLKRYLVNGKRIESSVWKETVRPAVRKIASEELRIAGDDAMPYVFASKDAINAKKCAEEWSVLLKEISAAVQSNALDLYVNGMIVQMKGE